MLRKLIMAVAACALMLPAAAKADTVRRTVGTTEFNFPVPAGLCQLQSGNARDSAFIAVLAHLFKDTNKLIDASADCGQVKELRGGRDDAIKTYAVYYTPLSVENLTLPGAAKELRDGLCDGLRKQGSATMDQAKDLIEKRAKELGTKLGVDKPEYIGVVHTDDFACYSAMLLGFTDPKGEKVLVSAVIAATVVKGKPLFLAFYDPYKSPQTTLDSLARLKIVAVEWEQRNP